MARDTHASRKPFLHLVLLFALLFQVKCFWNVILIGRLSSAARPRDRIAVLTPILRCCIVMFTAEIRSSHRGTLSSLEGRRIVS